MAESEAAICSNALALLADEPVVSLIDASERARLCARFYPTSRDEILVLRKWKCATLRVGLARLATPPLFGFAFAYQLPANCLRVWATNLDLDEGGGGEEWQLEGTTIVTNVNATLMIFFTQRVTDVLLFDPYLEKAITYDLAAKLAGPITQNQNIQDKYEKLRNDALNQAGIIHGQTGTKRRYRSQMLTRDVR